jgi:CRISPR-associated endonuclease Cas1
LHVDHGTLLVQDGFTHYPQERTTWRFFSGEWRVPSRIVILDANGSLTFDALSWLSRQNISLVQINWRGEVTSMIAPTSTVTDLALRRSQLAAQSNRGIIRLGRWIIQTKIANSLDTLRDALPDSESSKLAIKRISKSLRDMKRHPPRTLSRLLALEGMVGWFYFNAWRSCSLRWKGTEKAPIPDDWLRIGKRTSGLNLKASNRNATHPVNAILNYGYAMLENQMRMHVVARGLDPASGFLHGQYRGDPGLVFDLMEPLRPLVDRKVLEFVRKNTFTPGDFTLLSNGVCRLNPHLARNVVRAIDVSGHVSECVNQFVLELRKT